MDIQQIRKQRPEWSTLDDGQVVDVLREAYYPDMSAQEIADKIGVKPAAPPPAERTVGGTIKDAGISLLKGAIGVPEAAVGLADIPTGGRVGKALESVGFRPKEAKAILDENYSDPQKQAFQNVEQAKGFGGKFVAALQNPSVIGHSVAESLPSMGAGGVVGRGIMAAAPRVGGALAAGLGEGVIGAGSAAEQTRQQTADGTLTAGQAGLALASGAGTTAFGVLGNKIAKSLGIHDVDMMLVGAATNPAAAKGVVRRVLEGAASEGILEELPQSVQEQVLQNVALGKDITEGVDQAAVLGLLSGAAMGGGANIVGGGHRPAANDPSDTAVPAANDGAPPASQPLALPPPTITVGPDGTAQTTDQRQAGREAMGARAGAITERGPLSRAANLAAGDVVDVEAKPAGALSRAAGHAAAPTDDPQAVTAEPLNDTRAQIAAINDPTSGKDSALITPNSSRDVDLTGLHAVETHRGLFVTSDPAKAQAVAAMPDTITDEQMGQALGYTSSKPASDGTVVQAVDASGNVVHEEATNAQGVEAAAQRAAEMAPAGGNVVQTDAKSALDRRAEQSATFPTYEDADAYRKEQKTRGASVQALPAPAADGGFVLATKGTADYVAAEKLRDERRAAKERADAGILDGDITNKQGKAFTIRLPATNAAKKAGPGHEVVQVKGGFVVRKGATDVGGNAEVQPVPGSGDRAGSPDARASVEPALGRADAPGAAAPAGARADAVPAEPRGLGAADADAVSAAAHEAATSPHNDLPEPTQAQKEAGNYKKGHVTINGLDITIENPEGSERRGMRPDGTEWAHKMSNHYGYIKRTVGADDEQVDVYVGKSPDAPRAFVVDQLDQQTGGFDEHKVMLGFPHREAAVRAYRSNFDPGWKVGPVTSMTIPEFKEWLASADTKKPLAAPAQQGQAAIKTVADTTAKAPEGTAETPSPAEAETAQNIVEPAAPARGPRGALDAAMKRAGIAPYVGGADADYTIQVSGLGEVLIKIESGSGDAVHATVTEEYMGAVIESRTATGTPAIAGVAKELKADLEQRLAKAARKKVAIPAPEIDKLSNSAIQAAEPAAPTSAAIKKVAPTASPNKVFTEDAAAAARAMLKKKLGTLNSGIDPELLQAGITLAGYHIEKGARTFAAYAKAMVDDLGDGIRPYLKQLYMAVKFDPRATAMDGMDSAAAVEAVDLASIEPAPAGAHTGGKEDGNAARELDRPSTGSLEGAPAEDVRPAGEGGDAGAGADRSGRRDGSRDSGNDDAGRDLAGGVGSDARDVPVPARGTRKGAADAAKPGVSGAPRSDAGSERLRPEPSGLTPPAGPDTAPNAPPIAAPQVKADDFTIDDDLGLGEGGQKTKFKNNVAAIRLLQELDSTGRMATPDEQRVLAKYVGWGGLAQAFDPKNADWTKEHAELNALLKPDDLADARRSTRYAHYTSRPIIVDGIYAALRRFGFTGGKTLEAGAGVGNFLGLMPADMRSAGRFTAIEREPFSSAIAKHLYPQQNVQRADFTEFRGNDAYFDAAVGNPPFASDPQTDRSGRKHLSGLSLHNYFFAKSVDMLREGGVMAQVITNSFLDAKTDAARKYIGERTRFLGAIRLPNSAFAKNANTEVTTDIVFLQKLPDAEIGGRAARADAKRWLDTVSYTDKNGRQVALNRYFGDNPDMMLGDYGAFGTMYGPDQPALVARPGQDTLALLKAAVERLPAGIYQSIADTGSADQTRAAIVALKNPPVHEGGFFMEGDKLLQRLPDLGGEARGTPITPATPWTAKTTLGDAGYARIKALATMRGTVRGLIAAEMADDDRGMGTLRAHLNQQYDAYRAEHGLINDPSTLRVFDDDPDFPLLSSLEHDYVPGIGPAAAKRQGIKPTKSTAKKGPIFDRRVVAARAAVRKVDTPADALAVSMAERGKLDTAYIGELLDMAPDAVLKELSTGEKPLLFLDPATDEYVLRDAYLSGNVRAKLAQAKAAGMFANQRELEAVQPADVGAHEITARVGSPWVPEKVYEDFARELFGPDTRASVSYLKLNSSYQVSVYGGNSVAMTNQWGTLSVPGDAILSALMNNRPIKVTYRDSEGKTHTNVEATEAANMKAQEVREKFTDWLFADAARSEVLTRAYNDTNNNYVTRVYDGSMMTFPGKVPDEIIRFRRHQRNAIARTVQDRTGLYDHVVGAGKTFTVVASAMELKRTGLAKKNMVAVPNHLVKQWAADFYRLYPGANVLTATKKDFEKANRRKFLAKIATGDWDAVVIAHSSFGFIRPAPEFEAQFNRQQVAEIVSTINAVQNGDGDKAQKKRTVKQLEGLKERLENRIKALRDKPMDDLLDFEQIGVDQLFVDEAHMFKNLMFSTKMANVQGLGDSAGSQRAYDMFVKVSQIYAQNGRGQGVVFATGTPVSNSLAEMYHMMRYLMPRQMQELGFQSFDAWANTFASVEQVWMQRPSGDGFKASNRMSQFVNTPELLKLFDQVCDTVTMDDIKAAYREENAGAEFPLPKLKTGRRQPVSMEKSPAQEAYMKDIAERAKIVEARRGPPKKGDDNVLVIMSDARKAAMDIRLVDPDILSREKGGRIDLATDNVVSRYHQYHNVKGTQLVFSDLGTPIKHAKAELKEYEALRERIDAVTADVTASATLGDEAAQAIFDDSEEAQAELDDKGSDWLGAVNAALRGFSVYDDFKAALIEKGIPEHEIAFIHDYNTDDRKADLFKKVNAGQIRVLLGSTAKMGAGTNVQERVVAEHHLDVPWRPSDVEQREGRVIRQGNVLMKELPDFEVEILAYVTKDTLDMRMWQVQETKLKMINQLRTRQVGREVDNAFEDMELSAGEMQAAATGNMDLLREIQLRTDVKKLEQRRRSFDAQRNDLINRKKRSAEALAKLPAQIAEAETEAAASVAYYKGLEDAAAAGVSITIDGKRYTDRIEAQRVLRDMDSAKVPVLDEKGAPVLDEDGKPKTKAAPISVNIDGEDIKGRARMAEAFADAVGDADLIKWTVNGQDYNRRTRIASAIRQGVVDAIADQKRVEVGTIAGYDVAVEGEVDKHGNHLEVTLSQKGKVVLSQSIGGDDKSHERVVAAVGRMLEGAMQRVTYLQHDLKYAQRNADELAAVEVQEQWPDEEKLRAARDAHKAVLARLNAKPGTPQAGAALESGQIGEVFDWYARLGDAPGSARQGLEDAVSMLGIGHRPELISDANLARGVPAAVNVDTGTISYSPKFDMTRAEWAQVMAEELMHAADLTGPNTTISSTSKRFDLKTGDIATEAARVFASGKGLAEFLSYPMNPEYGFDAARVQAELFARLAMLYHGDPARMRRELPTAHEAFHDLFGTTLIGPDSRVLRDIRARSAGRSGGRGGEVGQGAAASERPVGSGQFQKADSGLDALREGIAQVFEADRNGGLITGQRLETRAGLNDPRQFRQKAQQAVSDLFSAPGTVSWWHKTVGTMHDLAQRSAPFRRVYDAVQTFLNDVSAYATEAAELAPNLLPKLETWRDIGKSPVSAEDSKAIAAPIFEGTLVWARDGAGKLVKASDAQDAKAGVVFTDAELKSQFKLTPAQIDLYREFRAATDQSLNRMTISEMLRFGGKDVAGIRDMAMDAGTAAAAGKLLHDYLIDLAAEQPTRAAVLKDTAEKIVEKADKAQSLIDHGYAPLSRFGHYTVDVLDEQGDRAFFGMFETRAEANRMARRMRENYPKGEIQQGTVSEQAYKMFAGITPETLELFGEMVGLEAQGDEAQHQMFQEYLKLAKANRSAMKRLIHRKGIAGFNEDAGRVLAGFIYSNARLTSTNLHGGEIASATNDVPKQDGELKDMAIKLADYVRNPQEEAQKVRGLLFAQYLGGSLASAMVNMTQPFAVTMPYLSQFGGITKSANRMRAALADVLKGSTGDTALDAALKHAEDEGIVAPQEVHQLMAQAQGRGALQAGDGTAMGNARAKLNNVASKVSLAWGKPFAAAEQFNRRLTFIAAYRTAVAEGIANPAKFAEKAIADTQFVYNKGNKPQWARGAIGSTLFTFKQYSVSYAELLHRMATKGGPEGRKAALFAIGMLFLMGGAGGLPFMSDAEDVLDGIMQRLGYNFSSKAARRQFLENILGRGAAQFVERGISGLPGVPIDVAGRLGMGNLIPGTGLLTKKADYGRDVAELLGPAGDLAQRAFKAVGMAADGKPVDAYFAVAPKASENLRKGLEMLSTGIYKDQKGRKVLDVDTIDAIMKAIGFQPNDVARVQEATGMQQNMIAQHKLRKTELADEMALAVFEGSAAKQQRVREHLARWNASNPESRITIDMLAVRRRVIEMRRTKAQRIEHTAPKAIRADVRAALQADGA